MTWQQLLMDAVTNTSKQQVANELGVSRTAISLIANGKYPASNEHIAKRVIDVYGRVACPHLSSDITQAQCRENRTRKAPISSPREMKFWLACQSCSHNTQNEKNQDKNPVNGESLVFRNDNKE